MFSFLFALMTMLPVQDTGCYIICETIDTVGWEDRTFISDNGIEHRTEPILSSRVIFSIPITCEDAAIIQENRLRVVQ